MTAFTFTIRADIPLTAQETCADVWPHDISPYQLAEKLRDQYGDSPYGVGKWLRDWNLEDYLSVEVNGTTVWPKSN